MPSVLNVFAQAIEDYVPYSTGELNDTTKKRVKFSLGSSIKGSISYTADYADEVYNYDPNAVNWDRSVHSKATSRWDEAALGIKGNRTVEYDNAMTQVANLLGGVYIKEE